MTFCLGEGGPFSGPSPGKFRTPIMDLMSGCQYVTTNSLYFKATSYSHPEARSAHRNAPPAGSAMTRIGDSFVLIQESVGLFERGGWHWIRGHHDAAARNAILRNIRCRSGQERPEKRISRAGIASYQGCVVRRPRLILSIAADRTALTMTTSAPVPKKRSRDAFSAGPDEASAAALINHQ